MNHQAFKTITLESLMRDIKETEKGFTYKYFTLSCGHRVRRSYQLDQHGDQLWCPECAAEALPRDGKRELYLHTMRLMDGGWTSASNLAFCALEEQFQIPDDHSYEQTQFLLKHCETLASTARKWLHQFHKDGLVEFKNKGRGWYNKFLYRLKSETPSCSGSGVTQGRMMCGVEVQEQSTNLA